MCAQLGVPLSDTVNLEIFARVLFSRNFAYAKFRETKSLQKGEITLLTTDIGESYPSCEIFWSKVCLLTLFAKLKFSRKILDLQYQSLISPIEIYLVLCYSLSEQRNLGGSLVAHATVACYQCI